MGRKSNTDLRREQIAHALLLEMGEVGYERASTKSIAARAGLAPGLLHYHFHNKEEVLLDLVERLIVDADQRCITATEAAATDRDKLAAYVSVRVGFGPRADERIVRAWVAVIAEATAQVPVRARMSRWLARDHARLKAWFRGCGAAQSSQLAATLLGMVLGSFSLRALEVEGIPTGYAETQLLRWLDGAVPASKAKKRVRRPPA